MDIRYVIMNMLFDPATRIKKRQSLRRIVNYFLAYYQYYFKHSRLISRPIYITVDISNICQLRCPLCPTGQVLPGREKKNMSFELFKKIIDELSPYAYGLDLYHWGEPFFNQDIFKMVKYAVDKGLFTNISTNFQILFKGKDFFDLLFCGLHHLIVSLDGSSQESYQKYRIGGDFQRVVENIKGIIRAKIELKKRFPFVTLQFLVNRHNEHEIDKIKLLAKELQVDQLSLSPILINIKNDIEFKEWLPQDQRYSCYDYQNRTKKKRQNNCNWLWLHAVINPDGGVSPCCHVYHTSTDIGNVVGQNFRAVWNNKFYRDSRRFLKERRIVADSKLPCYFCLKPFIDSDDRQNIDFVNESLTNKIGIINQ